MNTHTGMKAIAFHARGETPVLRLEVSRECIEWLIGIIPHGDGARDTLQRELDAVTPVAEIHGSRRTGHAVVRITRDGRTRRYQITLRRWHALRDRLIGGFGPWKTSGSWLRASLSVCLWERT